MDAHNVVEGIRRLRRKGEALTITCMSFGNNETPCMASIIGEFVLYVRQHQQAENEHVNDRCCAPATSPASAYHSQIN